MTLDLFQLSIAFGIAGATIALEAWFALRARHHRRRTDWFFDGEDDARE